jgi:hypothetical protein
MIIPIIKGSFFSSQNKENKMSDLLREARELLHGAAEPGATQEKADIGMCAQWDVEALALVAKIDAQLAAPVAAQPAQTEAGRDFDVEQSVRAIAATGDAELAGRLVHAWNVQKAQPVPAQGERQPDPCGKCGADWNPHICLPGVVAPDIR